jgi:hypothetical protein
VNPPKIAFRRISTIGFVWPRWDPLIQWMGFFGKWFRGLSFHGNNHYFCKPVGYGLLLLTAKTLFQSCCFLFLGKQMHGCVWKELIGNVKILNSDLFNPWLWQVYSLQWIVAADHPLKREECYLSYLSSQGKLLTSMHFVTVAATIK